MSKKWIAEVICLNPNGSINRGNKFDYKNTIDLTKSGSYVLFGHNALYEPDLPELGNWIDPNLLICVPNFERPKKNWWIALTNYNDLKYIFYLNQFILNKSFNFFFY